MELVGFGVVSLLLQGIHFHTKSGVLDSGFVSDARLVLGTGRRRKRILPPLVCLMEAVELRKDEGARPVSWARAGGCGGGAPAFAAALPPAPWLCGGRNSHLGNRPST